VKAALALIRRDLLIARRGGGLLPLAVFAALLLVFPLAAGPGAAPLGRLAPGAIWAAALAAHLVALDALFAADARDGSLAAMLAAKAPAGAVVLAKAVALWLAAGLPIALVSPLAAVALGLPVPVLPALVLSLLFGTAAIALLSALVAALALGRGGAALAAVLVLPLAAPVLAFGAGAAELAARGQSWAAPLAVLAALDAACALGVPPAAAAALRAALDRRS